MNGKIAKYTYFADGTKFKAVDVAGNGFAYTGSLRWCVQGGEKAPGSFYDISPYAYCAGDPVNLVDPDGKFNIKTGEIEKGNNLTSITKQING